jgi:hypothetical protein
MHCPGLRFDQLRPNNISHTICHEYCGSHKALLRLASNIGHSNRNDETDNRSKEPNDSISSDRCFSMVGPRAFPDDRAAGNDWQTAEDQKDQSDIGNTGGQKSGQENENETDST